MKQASLVSVLCFVFITLMCLSDVSAHGHDRCSMVEVEDRKFPYTDFDLSSPVEGYALSPSHNYILMKFGSEPEDVKMVLYQAVESGLQEKGALEHTTFILGSSWSHDETKLLLQDSVNEYLVYMYDIANSKLISLTEHLLPTLQIYQVAWMSDDQSILFAASEWPFPTTEYGLNGVIALYQMDLSTLEVTPVSQLDEQVDWYFYDFLSLSQNNIVYSSCSIKDDEMCGLKVVKSDETIVIDGNYKLIEVLSKDEALVQLRRVDNEEIVRFEIFILNVNAGTLTSLFTVPRIFDYPVPLLSLSPNKKYFTYMADETTLMLFDLEQRNSRFIASLDDEDIGNWLPNGNEFMYQTSGKLYRYDTNSYEVIQENIQVSQSTEFLWLCIQDK